MPDIVAGYFFSRLHNFEITCPFTHYNRTHITVAAARRAKTTPAGNLETTKGRGRRSYKFETAGKISFCKGAATVLR